MLSLSSSMQYCFYLPSTDMRKSFDSLCGLVFNNMNGDPADGKVYIFVNANRNKMKLLLWEDTGFVLFYKRLESGTFQIPKATLGHISMSWESLMCMLQGIRLDKVVRKKRYQKKG